jgi:DNA-directed RNA polymerase subunit RPC12/RpoP
MSYFCPTCSINLSCSKALKRHNNSKNHLKRLENNLKYVCHCGRTFTQSSSSDLIYYHGTLVDSNCNTK